MDGVLSISDIYPKLLGCMNKIREAEPISCSGIIGVGWSSIWLGGR